jgi:hypothetical protein
MERIETLSEPGTKAHDMRNEIKQSKQAVKKQRRAYQASKKGKWSEKTS